MPLEGEKEEVAVRFALLIHGEEQLGGFYVIECPSLQDAEEAARRLQADVVEVRPVVEET